MRKLIHADANTSVVPVLADTQKAPALIEATDTTLEPISRPPAGALGTLQQFDFGF